MVEVTPKRASKKNLPHPSVSSPPPFLFSNFFLAYRQRRLHRRITIKLAQHHLPPPALFYQHRFTRFMLFSITSLAAQKSQGVIKFNMYQQKKYHNKENESLTN